MIRSIWKGVGEGAKPHCIFLTDGTKIEVGRDPDVRGRTWLEIGTAKLVVASDAINPPAALAACPFCGCSAAWRLREDSTDGAEGWIQCAVCDARGPRMKPFALAGAAWNRRRQPNIPIPG